MLLKKSASSNFLTGLFLSLVVTALLFWQSQNIIDWWKLRAYKPSTQLRSIASNDTMTAYGQRLFYLNHPAILDGNAFATACTMTAEKTIVLGCYVGGDRGIKLYNVTDPRLQGVVEVTAAHEMLHAAYARLSPNDKKRIDKLLQQYYENLKDTRLRATIEAYKISEPTELSNEMHSVFGAEARGLPAELETYYSRYFTDRQKIVSITEHYQSEFTTRRDQAASYDSELSSLKPIIDSNETKLQQQYDALGVKSAQLASLKKSGNTSAYNGLVDVYNTDVRSYNSLLETTKSQIQQYNEIIEKRNTLALEERDLVEALSGKDLQ